MSRMQFAFGEYVLSGGKRELRRGSEQIALEPQVFDVLLYLVENRDRVVTKGDLIACVWQGRIVSDSTLTSRITAARRAVGDSGEQQALIRTYARRGFRFVGDLQSNDAPTGAPTPHIRTEPGAPRSETEAGNSVNAEPGRAAAAAKWGGRPSVAVLPFKNLSGDAGQDYFSDGISEDIINALSKHRSLAVIARNSSFAFKRADIDVRHVGLNLGAEYLLEGSVRKTEGRVRVTAQLA